MRVLLGCQEKEKKNPEKEREYKRKKKKKRTSNPTPPKLRSKALGGTWVPKLHPVPSQSSKVSEKT